MRFVFSPVASVVLAEFAEHAAPFSAYAIEYFVVIVRWGLPLGLGLRGGGWLKGWEREPLAPVLFV